MSSDKEDVIGDFLDEFREVCFRAIKNCKTEQDLRRVNANIQKIFRWMFAQLYPPDGR